MRPQRLNPDDLTAALRKLPGWTHVGDTITRSITYPTFLTAIEAVTGIATVAEEHDHHPDIDIRWRTLNILLTTHDAGGLSQLDIDVAHQIDAIATDLGASAGS